MNLREEISIQGKGKGGPHKELHYMHSIASALDECMHNMGVTLEGQSIQDKGWCDHIRIVSWICDCRTQTGNGRESYVDMAIGLCFIGLCGHMYVHSMASMVVGCVSIHTYMAWPWP